jgi:hypothetical protein
VLLQRARRREFRGVARGDLDRFAVGWVAAAARGAVNRAELAEAGERDFAAAGELLGDRLEYSVDRVLGLTGTVPALSATLPASSFFVMTLSLFSGVPLRPPNLTAAAARRQPVAQQQWQNRPLHPRCIGRSLCAA